MYKIEAYFLQERGFHLVNRVKKVFFTIER
jgi:hypothetical protein